MVDEKGRPLLAITMGDPGGVGPEVCAKALSHEEVYHVCRPLVIGDAGILKIAIHTCGLGFAMHAVNDPEHGQYRHGTIDILDMNNMPPSRGVSRGVDPWQGKASFEYIVRSIGLALRNGVDGTVTGPVSKASLNAAGYPYAGHTEIFADKTGSRDYAMMLADRGFRVVHVSTHVSLRQACNAVRRERVLRVIELAHDAVGMLVGGRPRIAVAGLNPHCGEGGLFGSEEEQEIAPAVLAAAGKGIDVEGPFPADTVFPKMRGGQYDAVIVMYHDQGHIPLKLLGFDYHDETGEWSRVAGVNVTLGLPIVRTSVDHGTAFDKAGQGSANPQSMIDAIHLAAALSIHR